jgi:hypothetical protein
VIADADCFLRPLDLRRLVALALGPSRWSLPTLCVRLTRAATRRVLASDPARPPSVTDLEDPLNPFQRCGQPENPFTETPVPIPEPFAVVQASALREVGPLDDSPWGGAEWWAGCALATLIGPPAVFPALAGHLWHPATESGSHRLWVRRFVMYAIAQGDVDATRELVAGEDLDDPTLMRLMSRWRIPYVLEDADLLDVACSALTHMRPAPPAVRRIVVRAAQLQRTWSPGPIDEGHQKRHPQNRTRS